MLRRGRRLNKQACRTPAFRGCTARRGVRRTRTARPDGRAGSHVVSGHLRFASLAESAAPVARRTTPGHSASSSSSSSFEVVQFTVAAFSTAPRLHSVTRTHTRAFLTLLARLTSSSARTAACCYRCCDVAWSVRLSVCLCVAVGHLRDPLKDDRNDPDAVWDMH